MRNQISKILEHDVSGIGDGKGGRGEDESFSEAIDEFMRSKDGADSLTLYASASSCHRLLHFSYFLCLHCFLSLSLSPPGLPSPLSSPAFLQPHHLLLFILSFSFLIRSGGRRNSLVNSSSGGSSDIHPELMERLLRSKTLTIFFGVGFDEDEYAKAQFTHFLENPWTVQTSEDSPWRVKNVNSHSTNPSSPSISPSHSPPPTSHLPPPPSSSSSTSPPPSDLTPLVAPASPMEGRKGKRSMVLKKRKSKEKKHSSSKEARSNSSNEVSSDDPDEVS